MVERFDNDEDGYLSWAEANPLGYILNVGKADHKPRYPMVHAVRHAVWTSKRDTYSRGDYIKVCSGSLEELESWAQSNYGRRLAHCRCMLIAHPSGARTTTLSVPNIAGVGTANERETLAGEPDSYETSPMKTGELQTALGFTVDFSEANGQR